MQGSIQNVPGNYEAWVYIIPLQLPNFLKLMDKLQAQVVHLLKTDICFTNILVQYSHHKSSEKKVTGFSWAGYSGRDTWSMSLICNKQDGSAEGTVFNDNSPWGRISLKKGMPQLNRLSFPLFSLPQFVSINLS